MIPGFAVMHHHGATISASPGASGSFHPAHLWTDLVRFTAKHEGADAAKRAAAALRSRRSTEARRKSRRGRCSARIVKRGSETPTATERG